MTIIINLNFGEGSAGLFASTLPCHSILDEDKAVKPWPKISPLLMDELRWLDHVEARGEGPAGAPSENREPMLLEEGAAESPSSADGLAEVHV